MAALWLQTVLCEFKAGTIWKRAFMLSTVYLDKQTLIWSSPDLKPNSVSPPLEKKSKGLWVGFGCTERAGRMICRSLFLEICIYPRKRRGNRGQTDAGRAAQHCGHRWGNQHSQNTLPAPQTWIGIRYRFGKPIRILILWWNRLKFILLLKACCNSLRHYHRACV